MGDYSGFPRQPLTITIKCSYKCEAEEDVASKQKATGGNRERFEGAMLWALRLEEGATVKGCKQSSSRGWK